MPSVKTRLMVVIRLICMVLVPGIGILIMSMLSFPSTPRTHIEIMRDHFSPGR